ncbi:hypothetical protein BU16DRAFT_559366 [Lophium mytilinum]|uniref:C3H1-type domain-containing protein n=1 Tax=Lophium mytilinum TaxID=390894 RepID=A0A6A6QYU9_9PEZI|nr:hypothetical protein BU16DRAFT_559366 [Lophium mytilinum]
MQDHKKAQPDLSPTAKLLYHLLANPPQPPLTFEPAGRTNSALSHRTTPAPPPVAMDLLASLIVPSQSQQHPLPLRPRTPAGPKAETPGTPNRRTCFFWYHNGACNRKTGYNPCPFSHSINPGVLVEPPPGYKHREPCTLPLCPLREYTPSPAYFTTLQDPNTSSSGTPLQSPKTSSDASSPPTLTGKKARYKRKQERDREAKKFERERAGRILGLSPSQQLQSQNQTMASPKAGQKRKHYDNPEPLISLQGRSQNMAEYYAEFGGSERKASPDAVEEPEAQWHLNGFGEGGEAVFEGAAKKRKMADTEGGKAGGKNGGTDGDVEWRGDWDTDYFRSVFGHPTP